MQVKYKYKPPIVLKYKYIVYLSQVQVYKDMTIYISIYHVSYMYLIIAN